MAAIRQLVEMSASSSSANNGSGLHVLIMTPPIYIVFNKDGFRE
jgi:hypothetical protein